MIIEYEIPEHQRAAIQSVAEWYALSVIISSANS